ncbi:MAG: hypothetical protein CL455_02955 [Acidimicrobiaceae bacterium]|nr:hypothetical protein [Acidimicrobiaceae bacterium]
MIRELYSRDIEGVLKLNNESVPAVNKLVTSDLENILSMSKKSWGIEVGENIVAALITLESGEQYHSDNYIWLETQFNNFCYVDRIMVDVHAKRNGYGKKLYATLESYAKEMGIEVLLCEVNVEPPNPQSLAFHTDLGWKPFHDREHEPGKKVRYFKKPISAG